MLKKMTLIAAATIALYGCGGGSSSGSSKDTGSTLNYPIQNSEFAPSSATKLNYTFSIDGQHEGDMKLSFQSLDSEQVLASLAQESGSEEVIQVVNDLVNYGVQQFYYSAEVQDDGEEDNTLYFAGTDGALHEITDAYLLGSSFIPTLMRSSPVFRLNGADVKEKSPNIDISEETVSLQLTLEGTSVKNMLEDFEDHDWVQALPDIASCNVTWQQQVGETGARKTFTVSNETIEAAYLTEDNIYNVNCKDMDSMEFATSAERWFNPSFGLIEQIERQKVEQIQISEEKATITAIEKE
ncbi:hypothetical protein [Photobacterium profundum]|uniref:Lipoprotein n=1 Tax=Photobacterium profundum (strain SS9) TaxID=298386 RepID=Q6LTX0_PHOPR|nr:hypothetical protein [Photobacterium profundum]CAG19255.1 Hypothetical protein PBPRA0842 [Photobacterium profundum SS9]